MKRYSAAEARQHLADLLDTAENGDPVAIERKGIRFVVRREDVKKTVPRHAPCIEVLDQAIQSGQWTWTEGKDGIEFSSSSVKKRRGSR